MSWLTPARRLRLLMNAWPPFLFAGIRVLRLDDDFRHARVRLSARWYARNYVGTHFGGSLFAMTDPFLMLMALHVLGRDYLVWDKAAEIEFVRAVREDVFAEFHLDDATIESIRAETADGERHLRWFDVVVATTAGDVAARVRKQIYVRRKPGR